MRPATLSRKQSKQKKQNVLMWEHSHLRSNLTLILNVFMTTKWQQLIKYKNCCLLIDNNNITCKMAKTNIIICGSVTPMNW